MSRHRGRHPSMLKLRRSRGSTAGLVQGAASPGQLVQQDSLPYSEGSHVLPTAPTPPTAASSHKSTTVPSRGPHSPKQQRLHAWHGLPAALSHEWTGWRSQHQSLHGKHPDDIGLQLHQLGTTWPGLARSIASITYTSAAFGLCTVRTVTGLLDLLHSHGSALIVNCVHCCLGVDNGHGVDGV